VPAQSPVFSAHSYSEIYGGSAGCTITVNGTSVAIGAGSNLQIHVVSVGSGTGTGCYLLGLTNNLLTPPNNIHGFII
jgi:hypothetical protein